MPRRERYALISSPSRSVRFSSGMFTMAIVVLCRRCATSASNLLIFLLHARCRGPARHFEQELKYLDVPLRFGKIAAPGVEAVTAKQKAVRLRMFDQGLLDR